LEAQHFVFEETLEVFQSRLKYRNGTGTGKSFVFFLPVWEIQQISTDLFLFFGAKNNDLRKTLPMPPRSMLSSRHHIIS
jgi:hypothetical protein